MGNETGAPLRTIAHRRWTRERNLALSDTGRGHEIWRLRDKEQVLEEYAVEVTLGKPFDVLKLRDYGSQDLLDYIDRFKAIVRKLYTEGKPRREVLGCPCCGGSSRGGIDVVSVFDVPYVKCSDCAHVFIASQPDPSDLLNVFEQESDLSSFYIDQERLAFRMNEIIRPKLEWVCDVQARHVGGGAPRVLDVGAGAGHFVAGCREHGLIADGWEISEASVAFARNVLNVELQQGNYLAQKIEAGLYDLVTFWGLLEYASDPGAFLTAAHGHLASSGGMLIIEVPRSDSLCLAVQQQFSETIWRHASPESHMNLFSDASIAMLLHNNGFRPVAAWYYGMDIYELLMQLSLDLRDDEMLSRFARLISPIQEFVDRSVASDDIVVAAVPVS